MDNEPKYIFVTRDFRPATPGWRVAYLTEEGCEVQSLVGWLVQEEEKVDPVTGSRVPWPDDEVRSHQVIAARVDDYEIYPAHEVASYWRVLAPEEPNPTYDEAMAEHGRRVEIAERAARREPSLAEVGGPRLDIPAAWLVKEQEEEGDGDVG